MRRSVYGPGPLLRYVADSALGWGEEEPEDLQNRSYFLDDHMLFDLDFGGILYYRLKGSNWKPNPTFNAEEEAKATSRGGTTASANGGGGGGVSGASVPSGISGTMGSPSKAKRAAEAMVDDVVSELVASQGTIRNSGMWSVECGVWNVMWFHQNVAGT